MIEIKGLKKSFGDNIIFENFNVNISDGEYVVFAGKSGCGKTTLLNMIGGLEKPDEGHIFVNSEDIYKRKNQKLYFKNTVGFLFQNFALVENKTVRQNLEFIEKKSRSNQTIEQVLERVGLVSKLDTPVFKLSGGEQQRIALARLMLKKCELILADEPTGSLDRENSNIVLEILKMLNDEGKTIVLVTHDERIIASAKRVINLSES